MKIEIELPRLILVGDYHDLDDVQQTLEDVGVKDVSVEEIGMTTDDDHNYVGLIYVGERPNEAAIKQIAAAQEIEFE